VIFLSSSVVPEVRGFVVVVVVVLPSEVRGFLSSNLRFPSFAFAASSSAFFFAAAASAIFFAASSSAFFFAAAASAIFFAAAASAAAAISSLVLVPSFPSSTSFAN